MIADRKNRKQKLFKSKRWWIRFILAVLALLVTILIMPLPNPLFSDPYSYTLTDRSGRLLQAQVAEDEQWRIPLPNDLPSNLTTCQILYEDEYYYWHPGVNPFSIIRAARQNLEAGKVISGGSTLSMQVVRLALGSQQRSYLQKAWEVLLTFKVELLYSKEDVLRAYLQHAPYGGNIIGASTASWRYFGRDLNDLSWSEAAMIAVLPNHPGEIFPGKGQDRLLLKRNALLSKLHDRGHLSDEEFRLSLAERIPVNWKTLPQLAPHLAQKLKGDHPRMQRVITTLDIQRQRMVQEIINENVGKLEAEEIYNAAAVVVDNEERKVLAYVGNAWPGNSGRNRYVDMLSARRSPGSLLKPYLYAHALDKGLILPEEWLPDYPIYHQGFAPQNFDKAFRGAVKANRALASSLNVPFVHLLKEYGYEQFHLDLLRAGIKLPESAGHYGMSLILGGFETSPLEIAGLYSGLYRAYRSFGDRAPDVLLESDFLPVQLQGDFQKGASPPIDWLGVHSVHHMLRAMTKVRKPEDLAYWKHRETSRTIAWKTGTSYGLRDAWAMGLSDEYTIVVWVGNATGEGRPGLVGSRVAAPLLFEILEGLNSTSVGSQVLGYPQATCAQSGMKVSSLCLDTALLDMPEEWYDAPLCHYHEKVIVDINTGMRLHQSCKDNRSTEERVFTTLPPAMAKYYKGYLAGSDLPKWDPQCLHQYQDQEDLTLIYPVQGSRVKLGLSQESGPSGIIMHAVHKDPKATLYWYVDDSLITTTTQDHKITVNLGPGEYKIILLDHLGLRLQCGFTVIP